MENEIFLYILAAIIGAFAIFIWTRKGKTVANVNKTGLGFGILVVALALLAWQTGYLASLGLEAPFAATNLPSNNGGNGNTAVTTVGGFQPTATFAAKDAFSTNAITGTSYYKRGSSPASQTAISNTNAGESITYWIDNATYWVNPVNKQAINGVTDFVATGFANGTATVTGYDLVNRQSTANGAYNTSMGANKQANIEITYQGTSKQSAMPFGGVLVVEANSSISSITCTGDDIASSNPYHLTYTTANTNNAYRVFAIGSTIDDGTGKVRKITCQFNNGASAAGAGAVYYVKFIPANWYVSQAGEFILDTEKAADGSVTRTGSSINLPMLTSYWGA